MKTWANIELSMHDPEIVMINRFEANLGHIPNEVNKIRKLITRHEVCHFKSLQHIAKIETSIATLKPVVNPEIIGLHHLHHNDKSWQHEHTGRSLSGQQYIWAMKNWLSINPNEELPEAYDKQLGKQIQTDLGTITADKARLTRLLLARLSWDWQALEKNQKGGIYNALESQIIRMDICHYAFPKNLDRLLEAIKNMQPMPHFEGCGSCSEAIRQAIKSALITINKQCISLQAHNDRENRIRVWLLACLIKTLKEQIGVAVPEIALNTQTDFRHTIS